MPQTPMTPVLKSISKLFQHPQGVILPEVRIGEDGSNCFIQPHGTAVSKRNTADLQSVSADIKTTGIYLLRH